jgi:preprotein translocase subunit SecE
MMQRQGALGPDGTPAAGSGRAQAAQGPGSRRPPGAGGPGGEREALPKRTAEYVREVRSELQKVAWPGRSEVANYTIVVLVAVVLLTLFVFGLDYGIAKGIIDLFNK